MNGVGAAELALSVEFKLSRAQSRTPRNTFHVTASAKMTDSVRDTGDCVSSNWRITVCKKDQVHAVSHDERQRMMLGDR